MKEYLLKVPAEETGRRLDLYLSDFFKKEGAGFSRTFIQELISSGKIVAKKIPGLKPHYKIKTGDEFSVVIEDKKENTPTAEDIPLKIIYEDDDLAVIDKQEGLVVHPAPGNYEHTLVNALLKHFKNLSDISPQRPGIVHRLDKETSGLLVIAKNNAAHLDLAAQFAAHSIKRKYVALVSGRMEFDENVIELPIGRHPLKRKSMAVNFSEDAKYAKTYYRTIKRAKIFSLVELEPFTGRTHQLRVHLAFIGHSILGDAKYGKDKIFGRLALHAKTLGFLHPRTRKFIEFNSEVPKEFKEFLKKA